MICTLSPASSVFWAMIIRHFASTGFVVCILGAVLIATATAHPSITAQPAPTRSSVNLGVNLTNGVTATTTNPPLSFAWRRNGSVLPGQTNGTLVLTNVQVGDAGDYSVAVSDSIATVESATWVVDVDPTFIDRSSMAPGPSPVSGTGVAWADVNNDGWPDLLVCGSPNVLYTNRGDGTLARVTTGTLISESGVAGGAAWGDYNNDGWVDLVMPKPGGNVLFRNDHGTNFTRMTASGLGVAASDWGSAAWGDYDRDGHIDLFVGNGFTFNNGRSVLYRNNGDGTFARITNNVIALEQPNCALGAAWGDYDDDGWPDLVVANLSDRWWVQGGSIPRTSFFYRNLHGTNFVKLTNTPVSQFTGAWYGPGWADYDNDGLLDLFMGDAEGSSRLLRNLGGGVLVLATNALPAITNEFKAQSASWSDYDNDGFIDLFVNGFVNSGSNPPDMRDVLLRNNGDGTFSSIERGTVVNNPGEGNGSAWGDVNRDGFPDLFVSNARTMPGNGRGNFFFVNNGNSYAWLTIRCEGRRSNRSGIGAKVRVKATIGGREMWQRRDISGSSGYYAQNDLVASFGLGDATVVELVRIEWPSGIVQELRDVAARQFLTVTEPDARISPEAFEVQAGESVNFQVTSTLEPPLALQWKLNGVALPGETNALLHIPNVQSAHVGQYSVAVHQLATGLAFDTPPARLSGSVALARHPQPVFVRLGSNAAFQVTASGISPLLFQWFLNGVALPSATNAILVLTNVGRPNEGHYSAVVSNSFGALTSSNAALVVLERPAIVNPPLSQTIVAGGTVMLSAVATGHPLPLTFRWLKGGVAFTNLDVNGTTGFLMLSDLQPTATTNRFYFRLVVTNLAGVTPSTPNAIITVLPDTDGDGLPDDWEAEHGLDSNAATDADMDADADGATNLNEYRAGTSPFNAQDALGLQWLQGSNGWALHFVAKSNHTYAIHERLSLGADGGWQLVHDVVAHPTNRSVTFVPPQPGGPARYYRVVTPHSVPVAR
jgi:enediyne biosynthesis protein E4